MKIAMTALVMLLGVQTFAQNPQKEEKETPALLYQSVKKLTVAIPDGPDGDEISNKPISNRLRTITPSRKISAVKQVIFTEKDAPGIAMMRSGGSCAPPVVEEGLDPVYDGVKAHMPLYLPYKSGSVGIWQGFYYNWDKNNDGSKDIHRAIDYGKTSIATNEDPTFGVYAIAPGKVIDVYWSNGGGNIVVIEHTAPDGYKYRSRYLHLRNGYDNDRSLAKNSPTAKYKSFAKNGTTSALCWGTNSQTIKVKKDDNVQAGQFLAYAGNTGSGGIGVILNDDGTLTNSNTKSFNVHLHFEASVQDTRSGHSGEWVNIDPYGTYNHSGVSCYDLESTTPYARLFAPFYPASITYR